MKTSILLGSAMVALGLFVSSCNQSTEPTTLDNFSFGDTTGNPSGPTSTAKPGKVTISNSPAGDAVIDSTRVSMVSSNTGDTIVYTTSGVAPTLESERYTKAFVITGSTEFQAAAVRGGVLGAVTKRTITITSRVFKPTFSTSRVDTFDMPPEVVITPANASTDTVYYTMSTNPGSPTQQSTRSTGKVTVTKSNYLVARSFNGKNEPSAPETTQIVLKVAKLTPSTESGNTSTVFNLFFSSVSPSVVVRYTTNGKVPNCTNSEQQKTDSIRIDSNQTVVAIGCREGWVASDTTMVKYRFKVGMVSTTPDSGVHESAPAIEFKSETPDVTYFYTTDSTLPSWDASTLTPKNTKTKKWTSASPKIEVKQSMWLRAVGAKKGWMNSDTMTSRFVYIGDSALIDDFELSGLGSKFGEKGLSWFACQYQNGVGCSQDQKFQLDRTLFRHDTTKPDYKPVLGFRSWRVQVGINQHAEDNHAGYVGASVKVPEEYPGNAYRLVFWAKYTDTAKKAVLPARLPFIVEMALKGNANNNGGYADGFHRKVLTIGSTWEQFEVDFPQFYSAGNGYEIAPLQPDSTSTTPKDPALFFQDYSVNALGLSGYQGHVTHNLFKPAWTWDVSKEESFSKALVTAFRFSIMQPFKDSAVAASVGEPSNWKNAREPSFTKAQLDNLIKDIHGYLWIDNVRLVRKSVQ
ncbi:MAG: chitobiase/beta-hexosaminidase C-terminal domain-containing protein [Fibrobacteria bacterium]|nr:chitobiase/beta-hexosaminidase C-terminal domain-containing protein [Fibrobacteria bacterium]